MFLDSSAIIDLLHGFDAVTEYVDTTGPLLTSTVCVVEVLDGKLGAGSTDVVAARSDFGGVQSIELTETIALEAARLQDDPVDDGNRLAGRDLMVAATARSTGDEFVVTDDDFQTDVLEGYLAVTNPRTEA
jgi:predicted nucleic acid-binding protein